MHRGPIVTGHHRANGVRGIGRDLGTTSHGHAARHGWLRAPAVVVVVWRVAAGLLGSRRGRPVCRRPVTCPAPRLPHTPPLTFAPPTHTSCDIVVSQPPGSGPLWRTLLSFRVNGRAPQLHIFTVRGGGGVLSHGYDAGSGRGRAVSARVPLHAHARAHAHQQRARKARAPPNTGMGCNHSHVTTV